MRGLEAEKESASLSLSPPRASALWDLLLLDQRVPCAVKETRCLLMCLRGRTNPFHSYTSAQNLNFQPLEPLSWAKMLSQEHVS